MDVDYIIKLTLSAYRLTDDWNKKNLLQLRVREAAAEVLKNSILLAYGNPGVEARKALNESLLKLEDALEWARREKLVSRKNFVFLKEEYGRVKVRLNNHETPSENEEKKQEQNSKTKQEIRSEQPKKEKLEEEKEEKNKKEAKEEQKEVKNLKPREEKIVEVLKEKERAQVNELKGFFPDISKRTLRRDIDSLLEKELITRHGQWNNVYYTLN